MWMYQVDILLYCSHELSVTDVPDEDFYINYDNGMSPRDMVDIIVGNFII